MPGAAATYEREIQLHPSRSPGCDPQRVWADRAYELPRVNNGRRTSTRPASGAVAGPIPVHEARSELAKHRRRWKNGTDAGKRDPLGGFVPEDYPDREPPQRNEVEVGRSSHPRPPRLEVGLSHERTPQRTSGDKRTSGNRMRRPQSEGCADRPRDGHDDEYSHQRPPLPHTSLRLRDEQIEREGQTRNLRSHRTIIVSTSAYVKWGAKGSLRARSVRETASRERGVPSPSERGASLAS